MHRTQKVVRTSSTSTYASPRLHRWTVAAPTAAPTTHKEENPYDKHF